MSIRDMKMIEDKSATSLIKWINIIVFLLLTIFVLLYQFVLIKKEASSNGFYEIGIFVNILALSVVTGYILYFITSALPNMIKCKKMEPVIIICKENLANELKTLIFALTKVENWIECNDDDLKEKLNSISATRKICEEYFCGTCPTKNALLLYNPFTLTILDLTIDNLKSAIEDIIQNGEYFNDLKYLKCVIWLKNSYTLKRISLCKQAAAQQLACDSMRENYKSEQIDSLFKDELSSRLFEPEKDSNRVFIYEIRQLIEKNRKTVL